MSFNKKYIVVSSAGILILLTITGVFLYLGSKISTKIIPQGKIELSTQYSKYLVGEEIKFKITNNFNSPIRLENNCPQEPLDVYRNENGKWVHLHAKADNRVCDKGVQYVAVGANSSTESSLGNWQSIFDKPGIYRLVAYVEYYNQLPYSDFEIIEKPKISTNSPNGSSATTKTVNSNVGSSINSQQNTTTATPLPSPSSNRKSQTVSIPEGSVKIEYDSSRIYVISITPASGYIYEGGQSGSKVEVTFKGNGSEVQLQLALVNGQIVQKIERD